MSGRVGALARTSTRFLCFIFVVTGFLAVAAVAANSVSAQSETMVASWYGEGFRGLPTSSGEAFNPDDYTAAHRELPFGTKLAVTYNGATVVVRVNDRGPFTIGRDIDLSRAAADAIGLTAVGTDTVGIEYVDASTPVGPSSINAVDPVEETPAPEATPDPPDPQVEEPSASQPQGSSEVGNIRDSAAVNGQYDDGGVDDDQYAGEDQYSDTDEQNAQDSRVAPDDQYAGDDQYSGTDDGSDGSVSGVLDSASSRPAAPVVEEVQVPPAELITPGSTVEKRIELGLAAPPANYSGPVATETPAVEAEAPAAQNETAAAPVQSTASGEISDVYDPTTTAPSAVSGLTVLPDTGGVSLLPYAGVAAALLVIGSFFGVRAMRGDRS